MSIELTDEQIAVRAGIPFVGLSVTLMKALRRLSFAAQTSGGVAGRDDELMGAIKQAQEALEAAKGKGLEEVAVDPAPASSEAASPADQVEDARDAARYRAIRQGSTGKFRNGEETWLCPVGLDSFADEKVAIAAMSATPPAAGEFTESRN